jgi:hypothetical protein
MKRIESGLRPSCLPDCNSVPPDSLSDRVAADLDDATLAHVTAMRVPFDQLRQAAAQIAGVLVLAVSGGSGAAGHPMLNLARTARLEANDVVLCTQPPARGAHHHRHLVRASRAIGAALDAVRLHMRGSDDPGTDAVLRPLRAGFTELQRAAAALPGFEVVAFSQGCCARHPA